MTPTQAEKYVAEYISSFNYWVGNFEKGVTGSQPFDLIAVGQDKVFCLDVKFCDKDYFHFGRVEENQKLALGFLTNKIKNYNILTGFVIMFENELYWLSFREYEDYVYTNIKSVKPSELITFKEVLDRYGKE